MARQQQRQQQSNAADTAVVTAHFMRCKSPTEQGFGCHDPSDFFFARDATNIMGEVKHLWRFAVKGLDRDELHHVDLSPGSGFPNDRRWALQLQHLPPTPSEDESAPPLPAFDPRAPTWMHKRYAPDISRH